MLLEFLSNVEENKMCKLVSCTQVYMNWSTILNKEIGKCTILNYTIIIVLKNAIALLCVFHL